MSNIQSLNIGCGQDAWGDIRIDVSCSFFDWHFRPVLLADACYLPFRNGVFRKVKASHVLEHVSYPHKALEEMVRVSTEEISLRFPVESDVWPFIISKIFPFPSFSALRLACQTRSSNLHLWIVNPLVVKRYLQGMGWKCSITKNLTSLLSFFENGRKARYFKWLVRHFRIPLEYCVIATRKAESTSYL